MTTLADAQAKLTGKLGTLMSGIVLKSDGPTRAKSPCPWCGGNDRFVTFLENGDSTCMPAPRKGCGKWVCWDESLRPNWSPQRSNPMPELPEDTIKARESLHSCQDWLSYHQHPMAVEVWQQEGFAAEIVKRHKLGFCESCPVLPQFKSMTIPVFYHDVLCDIRHRLLVGPKDAKRFGKYRSHRTGITPPIYNVHHLEGSADILIVEGSKKAITLDQVMATVGVPGVFTTRELFHRLNHTPRKRIFWGPDPGVGISSNGANGLQKKLAEWKEVTEYLGHKSYIADFFMKPDDMLIEYGPEIIEEIVSMARPL